MSAYTTLDLITAVKARGMFPDASSGSLSADNLLIYATRELHSKLVPMILAVREKYYETYTSYDITDGQAEYDIPERAIGGVISAVQYTYNLGIWPLQPIDPIGISTTTPSLVPRAFYFQNNSLVVYPTPNQTQGQLIVRYFQRPSTLVQTTDCAQIATIDTGLNQVTVSSIPSTWTTGTVVDFVPATVPYTPFGLDTTISGVSSTTVSFTALPAGLAVGDWLAESQTTPIPEMPYEFRQTLEQMTLVKALQAVGDSANFAIAKGELEDARADVIKLITPRDQLGNKKVVSNWRNW